MGHIGIMGFVLMYKCVKGLLILDIDQLWCQFQGTHSTKVTDEKNN